MSKIHGCQFLWWFGGTSVLTITRTYMYIEKSCWTASFAIEQLFFYFESTRDE